MKTKQKTLLALLIFVLCTFCLAAMSMTVGAADVTLSGSGTENNPYIVKNADEFNAALTARSAVVIKLGASFYVENPAITNMREVRLDLNSYTLTVGQNGGNGFLIESGCGLEISDSGNGGVLKSNSTINPITNNGTLDIYSGIIQADGGSALENTGTLTVYGGTIAGVHNAVGGTFKLNDGTISFEDGYGVTNLGTFTMSGGTVSGNTFGIVTGGWMNEPAKLNIAGGTIIGNDTGNIKNYSVNRFSGEITLSGGTLTNGINGGGPVSECLAEGYRFEKASGSEITIEAWQTSIAEEVKFGTHTTHSYDNSLGACYCGKLLFNGSGTEADPYVVTKEAELKLVFKKGGNVYIKLGSDITGDSEVVPANKTKAYLDLNGKTLDCGIYGLQVSKNCTLVVSDSVGGGILEGQNYGIYNNGGTVIVNSGTVTTLYADLNTAGIYNNDGSVTINGGTISGYNAITMNSDTCKVTVNGGTLTGTDSGVYIIYGTLTVKNGMITSKSCGVYMESGSTFTMSGGTVIGEYYGVYVKINSTFTMSGGEITGNSDGVCISEGIVNITGGEITGIDAGVDVHSGILTVSNCAINGGIISEYSGGLAEFLAEGYVFFVNGSPVALTAGQTNIKDDVTVGICTHTDGDGNCFCDVCGAQVADAKASQVSVTLDGDIGVNFYWTLTDSVANDASAYFLVKLPNGDTERFDVSAMTTVEKDGTAYYRVTGRVAAKEMADDVVVELYVGGELIESANCSVQGYAERAFAYSNDAELIAMMKAMLNYGAASQMLFGYNTADLANSILADDEKNVADVNVADVSPVVKTGIVAGITPTNFSCILETKTTLRHYFTIESGSIEGYTFKVGNTEVAPRLYSGNTYYVDIEDISATDLGKEYTFTITYGATTQTITASVESYMNSVIVNKDNENLVSPELLATVYAMHAYGTAAETYFN